MKRPRARARFWWNVGLMVCKEVGGVGRGEWVWHASAVIKAPGDWRLCAAESVGSEVMSSESISNVGILE